MTEDLQKVKNLLLLRKCSDRAVSNYLSCINRFKNYYKRKDLKKLNEDDILEYLKKNFINIGCSAATINVNRAAIKYYYLVNFNKNFSNILLPQTKIPSRFPKIISKIFFLIFPSISHPPNKYNLSFSSSIKAPIPFSKVSPSFVKV